MTPSEKQITVKYFAWIREKIGCAEEKIIVPSNVETVGDLLNWLRRHGPQYELALSQPKLICAAIDKTHVKHDTSLSGAQEIALFPPVTGG
ncbi:MAG: molybdopterin converting factor subunit 1 [Hyphomicrobium sp.]